MLFVHCSCYCCSLSRHMIDSRDFFSFRKSNLLDARQPREICHQSSIHRFSIIHPSQIAAALQQKSKQQATKTSNSITTLCIKESSILINLLAFKKGREIKKFIYRHVQKKECPYLSVGTKRKSLQLVLT